jgi:UDP-N-acetylglucosamine:LPS N-acetylglucosamine transferase
MRARGLLHAKRLDEVLSKKHYKALICVSPLFTTNSIDHLTTPIPCFILPTDFENRGVWLDSRKAIYLLASRRLVEQALENGIDMYDNNGNNKIIRISGMPVHPKFFRDVKSKEERKQELCLSGKKVVLVLFGSCGSYEMEDIMEEVYNHDNDDTRTYVFICGKNKKLYEDLCRLNKDKYKSKFIVLSFVHNIHHWMQASDVLLGKPGTGVITECMVSRLPIVVSTKGIMWQEVYNAHYIKIKKIGRLVKYWNIGLMDAIDKAEALEVRCKNEWMREVLGVI